MVIWLHEEHFTVEFADELLVPCSATCVEVSILKPVMKWMSIALRPWKHLGALPWEMVENSISPCNPLRAGFYHEAVQTGLLFLEPGSIQLLLRAPSPLSR
jgi:hypothetical protein